MSVMELHMVLEKFPPNVTMAEISMKQCLAK